jgi:hypothetical protein
MNEIVRGKTGLNQGGVANFERKLRPVGVLRKHFIKQNNSEIVPLLAQIQLPPGFQPKKNCRPTARTSLPGKKGDQLFTCESRLSQHRHQSPLWHISIVLRDDGAAARNCIIKNEVASRGVIQSEAVAF